MAVSAVLLAVGAFASITFEPPVKVGVSGEPGYCYGFGSETKATPSINRLRDGGHWRHGHRGRRQDLGTGGTVQRIHPGR